MNIFNPFLRNNLSERKHQFQNYLLKNLFD
jgi:hypothetical protein